MRSVTRVVALILVGLSACLDSTAPSKTGGLSLVMPANIATLDSGHVVVTGPTNKTVTFAPGETKTVDGLTPGTYTVGLEGFLGGGVSNFTQITGVTVVAGKNAAPAVPSLPAFRPAILSIPAYTVDGMFPLVFSKVAAAKSYVVQRSASPTFTPSLDTSIAVTDTSVQISIPVTGPFNVRVLAIDTYGTKGQPSVAQAVTTLTAVTVSPGTGSIAPGQTKQFSAVAKDAQGNPISGIRFFWASSNQNVATVDSTGLATGVGGGSATISALGLGVPGSAALTVTGPVPTQLAFSSQPTNATAGAAISPAVQVEIQDASGNRITTARNAVTLAIGTNPGTGTLSGTLTVNAVSGVATFSGLSIDKGGTGYTLTASSGTLTGATSATFDIAAAPAATQLAFTIQPTNATAGAAISPAVQVEVRDATGARVTAARDPVTLAIGTNPGTGTLSGTSTVNAVNGVATFSGLSIDKAGTGYTLTASSGTLTGATSAAFDIAPAPAATQLAFVVQPSNATTGTAISPAIQVEVRDATGVRVATAGNPVKLAIGANPGGGVLSGTTAVNAVNGVATFSGLSIDFAGTGYTLVASSATLTSATSAAFNVAARGVVYIIRDSDAKFQRLDPNSLAITDVGALGVGYNFGDCAWNPSNNTLYMVDGRATNTLYRINLLTGAATAIGVHGITDMFALGYHPPTNAIYGITFSPSSLYRFNLTTGAATLIGPTGVSSLEGLVWDPVRSQFVALHTGSDALYTIDVATGAATLLRAAAGSINDAGLTYDPVIDRFWSVDYSGNLFRYDPTLSYVRTSVLTGLGTHTCIAYVR